MKPKQTLLLVAIAVIVLGSGWYTARNKTHERTEIASGTLLFPNLAPSLQTAARVEITSKGKTIVIAKSGDDWGIVASAGYRVQPGKLRELLTGLTELRLIEPRTSDPEQFARLGLDDPAKPDAAATLLRVLDGGGKALVELITGHRRMRTQGNVPESIYLRSPGETRTWLAEGRLAPDADASLWLDRDVLNIAPTRIATATITRGDAALEIARAEDKFIVRLPAEAGTVDGFKLDEVGRALESLSFLDVKEAKDTPGEKLGTGRFVTNDGLVVIATLFRAGNDIWVQFEVSGADAAKDEATLLANRLRGWAYQVGAWKEKAMVPSLEDLRPTPLRAAPATQ
ncbi:MAG: DUF4340 domain-containing protein [Acetobacteraceae bacterium]|nr:DUF4340 domain-containing protein [Acetobacteraceae bacterium]MSP28890.1 DUF4340 domain-containing protein [Acetobacteraceae bacterium]